MNCQNIAEILDDDDSRNLSATERRAFDAHVAGCAECRAAFAAHEAMEAMALPAMSPELEEQCRRLVVAQTASRGRRVGGRPFVVVGLLLAGAAAATILGINVIGGPDGDPGLPEIAVTDPVSGENANEPAAMPTPESAEAIAAASEPAVSVPTATGFTVGVSPLRQTSTNPEVIRATEAVYRAVLDELRKIPNIELVMLAAGELEATKITASSAFMLEGAATAGTSPFETPIFGSTAISGPPGGAIEFEPAAVVGIVNTSGPVAAGTASAEARTLVLVDSRRLVQPGSDEQVDLSTAPAALARRIEEVTGGDAAAGNAVTTSGIVNVILDNNVEGVRVDMSYNTTAEGHAATMEPAPLPYDVMLEAIGYNRPDSNSWSFAVRAMSRGWGTLSTSVGAEIGEAMDPSAFVKQLIATLQAEIFPVDEALLAAVTANVLDRRMPVDEWLLELNRLKQMTARAGNTRLSDDVARAIVDMSLTITDPRQLSAFLKALEGVDDAVLVQPLGNALRNGTSEGIRVEAAMLLARFRQDPTARAALEAAASADPSPVVRLNARWAALDEAGHRNLIVSTLLDTRLTDAERIEPLLLDLVWAGMEPVDLGSAIDVTVVNELSEILRRQEHAATRARVLGRLWRESSPALTQLFVQRLTEDESEMVRITVAQALGSRLDEPGVRYALERAAASDPISSVREMASHSLEGGNDIHAFATGN